MKRAKVTVDHFGPPPVNSAIGPFQWQTPYSESQSAAIFSSAQRIVVGAAERRDPANARLRELMDAKRTLDNAIHAERLRLQR